MAFTVFRMDKLKTWGDVGGCGSHNLRQRPTPNADQTRENHHLIGGAEDNLVKVVRDKIGDQTIRKNAVLAVEFVMSASAEYFRPTAPEKGGTWDESRLKPWVESNMAWLRDRYGDRVVSAVLHLDELTPHIQAVIVPLDDKGKLNARALFGGSKHTLSELQTDYAKAVEGLGIRRGIEGSAATHTTVMEYYNRANVAFSELPKVTTPAPLDPGPEPEKPGLFAGSVAKERYRLDRKAWERDKATATAMKTKRREEYNARINAAVVTAQRHEAQAKEAEGLRGQVESLKTANGQLVQQVAKLKGELVEVKAELAETKRIVGAFTPVEIKVTQDRQRREAERQARKASEAAHLAEVEAHQAKVQREAERRAAALPKLLKSAAGAAYTFARRAIQAIRDTGTALGVDWGRVEVETAQEAVHAHQRPLSEVYEAIRDHSPGAADPARYPEIRAMVDRVPCDPVVPEIQEMIDDELRQENNTKCKPN